MNIEDLQDWMLHIHAITANNWKEIVLHTLVSAQLSIKHYFAKSKHAWEMVIVTHLTNLIRKYFKESWDVTQITEKYKTEIINQDLFNVKSHL